jgi:hypothetical protein
MQEQRKVIDKPVRAGLAVLAGIAALGLGPTAAKAQVIVGVPQPVVVLDQPAPDFGANPVFTYSAMPTYFNGFTYGTNGITFGNPIDFGFNAPFGTAPTTGFTFGPPLSPGGYYDWPGGPPPQLDIGPAYGLPIANGIPVNSPFVANPAPVPEVAPNTSAPAPAEPVLPEYALVQHGPAYIYVHVGRTAGSNQKKQATVTRQTKPKTESSKLPATHKKNPPQSQ